MNLLDSVKQAVDGCSYVTNIDVVRSGAVRLCTSAVYADGHFVDVFVVYEDAKLRLSDYGQTMQIEMERNPGGKVAALYADKAFKQILSTHAVKRSGSALEIRIADSSDITKVIDRLINACTSVSVYVMGNDVTTK